MVASTVTESHAQDPSQVPELLSQVDGVRARFIGDGIFDQAPLYSAIEHHAPGARVIIPPRKEAVLSATASTAPTQRAQQVLAIEREGRCAWKWTSGYDAQSQAEHAVARCKRTFGGGCRSKRDASQKREAALACELLKRMQALGRPQAYAIS
jgi:hypothetical protein